MLLRLEMICFGNSDFLSYSLVNIYQRMLKKIENYTQFVWFIHGMIHIFCHAKSIITTCYLHEIQGYIASSTVFSLWNTLLLVNALVVRIWPSLKRKIGSVKAMASCVRKRKQDQRDIHITYACVLFSKGKYLVYLVRDKTKSDAHANMKYFIQSKCIW